MYQLYIRNLLENFVTLGFDLRPWKKDKISSGISVVKAWAQGYRQNNRL
jgi:hypothetical protein